MKTILITDGTDGLGKGLAMHFLKKGERVIIVGSSSAKGEAFLSEAKQMGAADRAIFIQANLSLIEENQRVVEEVKNKFDSLDTLIFCAAKHSKTYTKTNEGFEFTFALAYLSRFILSYGLKECLEKSRSPIILNICGTGMKGAVNWEDLGHKNNFESQKVMMHGSRLNDLLGVAFVQNDTAGKMKYVLYNPMAVRTPGMTEASSLTMKLIYKFIGKPVEKAIAPIVKLAENPPSQKLSAFIQEKPIDLSMKTFDKGNALKLYEITTELLKE